MNESTHLANDVFNQNDIQHHKQLGYFSSFRESKGGPFIISISGPIAGPISGALMGFLLLMGGCNLTVAKSHSNNIDIQNKHVGVQVDPPSESISSTVETVEKAPLPQNLASAPITETTASGHSRGGHQDEPGNDGNAGAIGSDGPANISTGDRSKSFPAEHNKVVRVEDNAVALTQMVNQLESICDNLTQTNYESQHLRFPNNTTTAYVKGQINKVVEQSTRHQSDSLASCHPEQQVTPKQSMVIQRGGSSILIDMESFTEGYMVTTPVSYSANGQYLIASVEVAYTGGNPGTHSIIFDLDRREKLEMESYICKGADFDKYLGFIQPSEVAFRCSYYDDSREWTEVLDLETRSVSKTPIAAEILRDYGTVVQPFQYALNLRSLN